MHEIIRATGKTTLALSVFAGITASPEALEANCECQWNGQCYSQGSRICFGYKMECQWNGGGYSWEYLQPYQSCK